MWNDIAGYNTRHFVCEIEYETNPYDFYGFIIKNDSWMHLEALNNNVQLRHEYNAYDPRQLWHFVAQADGTYKIINCFDDRLMSAENQGTGKETNIVTADDIDAPSQKWHLWNVRGLTTMRPSHCEEVLDVYGGYDDAGTNLWLWERNGSTAQSFFIYDVVLDGRVYHKPDRPEVPVLSIPSDLKEDSDVRISWRESNCANELDVRFYSVSIMDSDGTVVYAENHTTSTFVDVGKLSPGAYSAMVTAVNSMYVSWYSTASEAFVVERRKTFATIVTQPRDCTVPEGFKASTSVNAEGEDLMYQWYIKNRTSSKFSKSSVTKNTYSVTMSDAVDGRQLYCVVTDKYGSSVTSDTVTMNKYVMAIISQPHDCIVPEGSKASATVKVEGEDLTYQWYIKNRTASKFSKSSVTKNTYSVTLSDAVDGRQLYCVVTDKYGNSLTTDIVTLRKYILAITSQLSDAYVASGTKVSVAVDAEGDGLTYQWYIKNASATKFSKSSVTKATYSTTMSNTVNGRQVYCVVSDAYGNTVTSDTATLYMATELKIVSQPTGAYAAIGENVKVTVVAEGDELTYQWYVKSPKSATFSKSSITKAVYSVTMTENRDGTQLYCVIYDRYGNMKSTRVVTIMAMEKS